MRRMAYILKRGGRINLPEINGREIRVHPVSPLGRAQEQQDILNVDRCVEQIQMRFGPQMVGMMFDQEKAAKYLAERWGVPKDLIRSDLERKQLVEEVSQMAGQAMEEGVPPQDLAKAIGGGGGAMQ